MKADAVGAHAAAINACNQRGGRMLSLIDLLDAGTVDLPLAAYLAARMRSGASLLVGARPGGAGKTTVMCALLNFLPDECAIRAVADEHVLATAAGTPPGSTCYIAHEIGAGPYFAYVWGAQARQFFATGSAGHTIASNLHTDTLSELYDQLCGDNGVPEAHVRAVTLKTFIACEGAGWRARRILGTVYSSIDGEERLVWRHGGNGAWQRMDGAAPDAEERRYAVLIDGLRACDARTIEDVRCALTEQSRVM
jgi:hypothetical protein